MNIPHDSHDEESHDEPWLVSYADLMTLLFGLFVLMYTFAAAKLNNDESMILIRKELAQFFGGNYINPLDNVARKAVTAREAPEFLKEVDTKLEPGKLEITLRSTNLFESGRAALTSTANSWISEVVQSLKALQDESKEKFGIRIEGHTDDTPTLGGAWASNWELSGARASTVVQIFEKAGFDPILLTVVGYGASRPLVPNRDESGKLISENLARNRRVVIVITQRD